MSVQFGRWNLDGEPVDMNYLQQVHSMIAPYGPDGGGCYKNDNLSILYQAFYTTKESHQEVQPCVLESGAVLTWNGRLDNREDLISELPTRFPTESADVAIVAAAYEHWGSGCFAKLIGDWALSAWNPADRSLVLAKDFVGTRHLYYSIEKNRVTWSTVLDPLVLLAGHSFPLEEEYIAGWLSLFPAPNLTPYVGIQSVPPCCFVRFSNGLQTIRKYWEFDDRHRIRHRTDQEYEEHFRAVFANAVRCRLRSDKPVLAELSGGMDSSSIVCMADAIIGKGGAETPRLDTVSYYDEAEPNWNEQPYFTKVEEKRGQVGCHIDAGAQPLELSFSTARFAAIPCPGENSTRASRQLSARMRSQGNRVLLSGIGGDEVLGGVPTPIPELQDLLREVRLKDFAHQLKMWALSKRRPWFHLLVEAIRDFVPPAAPGLPKLNRRIPWLHPNFVERHRLVLAGYPSRLHVFGPLPSFQQNIAALEALRRQVACCVLTSDPPLEVRYPYLDRNLLEFLYAVPREQLVRPGQRRSLMRRAFFGIVPDELLNRRRKAFVARSPMAAISKESAALLDMSQNMVSSLLTIVEPTAFRLAVQRVRKGEQIYIVAMLRTLEVEAWLLHLKQLAVLPFPSSAEPGDAVRELAARTV